MVPVVYECRAHSGTEFKSRSLPGQVRAGKLQIDYFDGVDGRRSRCFLVREREGGSSLEGACCIYRPSWQATKRLFQRDGDVGLGIETVMRAQVKGNDLRIRTLLPCDFP